MSKARLPTRLSLGRSPFTDSFNKETVPKLARAESVVSMPKNEPCANCLRYALSNTRGRRPPSTSKDFTI